MGVTVTAHDDGATAERAAGGRLGYRSGLDGLRGVAIVAVMGFHGGMPGLGGGFLGVDVFFVLSGFLITSLLLDEHSRNGGVSVRRFYARRALRLLPALGVVLVATAGWVLAFEGADARRRAFVDIAWTALYVQNWSAIFDSKALPGLLEHAWSLAVEEQFYVLWPLLVVLCIRGTSAAKGRARLLRLALPTAAIVAVSRAVMADDAVHRNLLLYGTPFRLDELLIGAALAATTPTLWRSRRTLVPGVVGAAAIGVLFATASIGTGVLRYGSVLLAVSTAAVIATVLRDPASPVTRLLELRPAVELGRLSYSLYLWHWPVFLLASEGRTGWHGVSLAALRLAVTGLLAVASRVLVEQPFLRVKRRLSAEASGTIMPGGVLDAAPAGELGEPARAERR